MAEIRQGYLDDYTQITSGNVGIGTSISNEKLEIIGGTTTQELNVSGIATFAHHSGFVKKHTDYNEHVGIGSGDSGTLSGEIIVGSGLTMSVSTDAIAGQGSLDSLKVSNMFQPPSGTTNQRPVGKPGSLFYNFDLKTIEYFDGNGWRQVDNTTTRGRAVFTAGGAPDTYGSNFSDYIDFVNIATLGNAQHFGRTLTASRFSAGCSSGTRGVFSFGYKTPGTGANEIEYITIAAGGNSIDFGDNTVSGYAQSSLSSSTRGIWAGVQTPSGYSNVIDYVEMATIGNALDFGDTTTPLDGAAGVASPTRGVICGGRNPSSGSIGISDTQFITIASKGNSIDDADLSQRRKDLGGMSSSTRGVLSGGYDGAAGIPFTTIDTITIASLGNAKDFGNLTFTGGYCASASSQTRGIIAGGGAPARLNNIDYITISTAGNAQDFGDLTVARYALGGLSDSHGGLGGF
tara:strand:+ start:1196 stop:2575 length:1380 start_codon:yes stop_codon:yes gene_type:complete